MTTPELAWIEDPPIGRIDSDDLLVLGPSLGTTARVWEDAGEVLRENRPGLRVVRVDLPGHGASPPAASPFTMGDLALAVVDVAGRLGATTFHYAGLSLGGAIGIELALAHPRAVSTLGIVSSAAQIATPAVWAERARVVRASGTAALLDSTPGRWFARDFVRRQQDAVARALDDLAAVDDESYALCVDALAAFDRRGDVAGIQCRVTVVNGTEDPVTTTDQMARLAASIPGSVFVDFDDSSHLVPLEKPFAVATALL